MASAPVRSLDDVLEAVGRMPARMGWRWRAVALWTVLLLAGLVLQSWWLSTLPQLPFNVRVSPDGALTIHGAPDELGNLNGQHLLGLSGRLDTTPDLPLDVRGLQPSQRWMARAQDREAHASQRRALAELNAPTAHNEDGQWWVYPDKDPPQRITLAARGWWGLGTLYWMLSALSVALACVGGLVWLSSPRASNAAHAVLAVSTAIGLSWTACTQVMGLTAPLWWTDMDPLVRWWTELTALAAVGYNVLRYPTPMPHARLWTAAGAAMLAMCVALWGWVQAGGQWWMPQSLMLGMLLAMITALHLAQRVQPHPVRAVMMQFLGISTLALALISAALSLGQDRADLHLTLAQYGVLAWQAFLASLVLTMPYLSRTRSVFQDFSWLAVSSTVAASLDLLFVAVFSMGVFTSMTLSLFMAFGLYLCLRRSLLHQLPAGHRLSREHLFERLYRAAREVERSPHTLPDAASRLMREVFQPMRWQWTVEQEAPEEVASVRGQGTVLLVWVPSASAATSVLGRTLVMRHAQHGQRLFTTRDVQLAQYMVQQLTQASRLDAAVEQGKCEERMRIAQDLHDDIGARLLTLMYQAPSSDIEDYIRHTIQDLKTLTRGLAASSHPLSDAASEWKRDLVHRFDVARCELHWHATWDEDIQLSMVQWSALTRILRELASNVLAHAKASKTDIRLSLSNQQLQIQVSDDGCGASPERWSHGLGLGGVRKRVKQLGGTVTWRQREPRGIACEILIPHFTPPIPD